MKKKILYGRHHITKSDINSVINVLNSDYLTQGPKIKEFEKKFSKFVGSKYSIAVSNGTAALHLSSLVLGVNNKSNVITTPITFSASANCIKYCGGNIYFSDINPDTYLLDINKLKKLIDSYPKGFFTGIIPVNFSGRVLDLERLNNLAKANKMWILEDSCHSPGGYFYDSNGNKQLSGNGIYSDLSIFSFHPVKHIAAGEGGMITTNNYDYYKKLLLLRNHGIERNSIFFQNKIELSGGESQYPLWYMELQNLGYNYRLDEISSALGLSQLKRIKTNIKKRVSIAKKYYNYFKDKSYIRNCSQIIDGHAYHLFIIEVDYRLKLFNYLISKNIFCQIHYIPLHFMPYYKKNIKTKNLNNSELYYERCISLPIYPELKKSEQQFVIKQIEYFYLNKLFE